MEAYIVKALFALYVVTVSLVRLMAENEYFRLTAMKKVWGRSRGLLIHFLSNVILPMLFAIYFICRGIVGSVSL
jgi:hypothetical protein